MKPTSIEDAAAKKALTEELRRLGWGVKFASTEGASSLANYFYLVDVETGYVLVSAIATETKEQLIVEAKSSPFTFDDICGALGTLIGDLSQQTGDDLTSERMAAGICAAVYMFGTRTYELACERGMSDCCFMILRYPDVSRSSHIIRPAAFSGKARFTPEELQGIVEYTLASDKRIHPERFPTADILPFQSKRFDKL